MQIDSYEFLYQIPEFEKFKITENEELEKKNYIIFSHGEKNNKYYEICFEENNNFFIMKEDENQIAIRYKTLSESNLIEITSCSFKKKSCPALFKKMLDCIIMQEGSPFAEKK